MDELLPKFTICASAKDSNFDCLVVCGKSALKQTSTAEIKTLEDADSVDSNPNDVRLLYCANSPGKRIVFVTLGNTDLILKQY